MRDAQNIMQIETEFYRSGENAFDRAVILNLVMQSVSRTLWYLGVSSCGLSKIMLDVLTARSSSLFLWLSVPTFDALHVLIV